MRDHSQDKSVQVMGHNLKYFTKYDCSEYHDSWTTHFYKETVKVQKRKWWFFGPIVEGLEPIVLFKIYANALSPSLPKTWWRKRIEHEIDLLYREEELKKGELV